MTTASRKEPVVSPFSEEERSRLVNLVLNQLLPARVKAPKPLDWFVAQFDFLEEEPLAKHLGEAYYQARLANSLRETLRLPAGFQHLFHKVQIVLYASIYEAVIDHFLLQLSATDETVSALFTTSELQDASNALAKGVRLVRKHGESESELVICTRKQRSRSITEIRFSDRMAAAVSVGLVPKDSAAIIEDLYDKRNRIHLLKATSVSAAPEKKDAIAGFVELKPFIDHVRAWSIKHGLSAKKAG